MCTHICTYICTYIHIYIHTYVWTYMHTYVHMCTHVYIIIRTRESESDPTHSLSFNTDQSLRLELQSGFFLYLSLHSLLHTTHEISILKLDAGLGPWLYVHTYIYCTKMIIKFAEYVHCIRRKCSIKRYHLPKWYEKCQTSDSYNNHLCYVY